MSRIGQHAGVFSALEVAASGLTAERSRMNLIASNLANAKTTKGADGQPYKRVDPVFEAVPLQRGVADPVLKNTMMVNVARVHKDTEPGQMMFEPDNPDANPDGYVEYPNVNVVTEMVNLMTASRAYEAGVATIESVKSMARSALKIGQ